MKSACEQPFFSQILFSETTSSLGTLTFRTVVGLDDHIRGIYWINGGRCLDNAFEQKSILFACDVEVPAIEV